MRDPNRGLVEYPPGDPRIEAPDVDNQLQPLSPVSERFHLQIAETEPWLRLPEEPPRQWRAFVAFRDLGPKRSLQQAADIVGEHYATVNSWGRRWEWAFRVQEFDRFVQKQAAVAVATEHSAMLQRHAGMALKLQELALKRLAQLDPSELSPKDVLAFLKESTQIERAARDALQQGQPQLEEKSVEEKPRVSGQWMGDIISILSEAGALPEGVTIDAVSEVVERDDEIVIEAEDQ